MAVEQEVKLAYDTAEAARRAVLTAGGRLDVARRLVDDGLFDTADQRLSRAGVTLRVRRDGARAFVTVKGPIQPGVIKSREELETPIGDAAVFEAALALLGYTRQFHAEKFREEYVLGAARVTVDEAPLGVFVEIEAAPDAIATTTAVLGRTAAEHRGDSYPALWREWCAARGLPFQDMTFEAARAVEARPR